MTPEDIDNLQAGRELDALVVTEIMGYEGCVLAHGDSTFPPYSTDIAAAWLVVEKLSALKLRAQIEDSDGKSWTCTFHKWIGAPFCWDDVGSSIADTAPLAICRAALRAMLSQGDK